MFSGIAAKNICGCVLEILIIAPKWIETAMNGWKKPTRQFQRYRPRFLPEVFTTEGG
jgi:hypothetical protein